VLVSDYLSNAIEAVDRTTGRSVWRFHGESGFVGFPEAPIVVKKKVYAASGDKYVYALDLSTGRVLWRTKTRGSNEAYAICGKSLLVSSGGLTAFDPQSGRITQRLLGGDEFVTTKFAVLGKRAFVLGPKAVYAFSCR
jgi:outer membrane protein assembly factor BamB